jgi:hypothetical protein
MAASLNFPLDTPGVLALIPALSIDRLRHAVTFLMDPRPDRHGRRFAWFPDDVLRLARITSTLTPELAGTLLEAARADAQEARRRLRRIEREVACA